MGRPRNIATWGDLVLIVQKECRVCCGAEYALLIFFKLMRPMAFARPSKNLLRMTKHTRMDCQCAKQLSPFGRQIFRHSIGVITSLAVLVLGSENEQ